MICKLAYFWRSWAIKNMSTTWRLSLSLFNLKWTKLYAYIIYFKAHQNHINYITERMVILIYGTCYSLGYGYDIIII